MVEVIEKTARSGAKLEPVNAGAAPWQECIVLWDAVRQPWMKAGEVVEVKVE